MSNPPIIDVVIPAYNESASIPHVLADIPKDLVRNVVVVDNRSTDGTGDIAKANGAEVVREERPGYGSACLCGIDRVRQISENSPPDIVVFLDADYSDYPNEMPLLIAPIREENLDLVIGSRALGNRERGAMMPQQLFGNWLATLLIKWLYGIKMTDLGPFRAITWKALEKINMQDTNFGWTVEMQVKAAKQKLNYGEIPVSYRNRIGVSKITGTLKGTMSAGYKIIYTIFKYA